MGRDNNRVSFAADTYPLPRPAGSAGNGGSGFYYALWSTIRGGAGLYALPSDSSMNPQPPPWSLFNYFTVPRATTLKSVHLKGAAGDGGPGVVGFDSTNTVIGNTAAPPTIGNHAIATSGDAVVATQAVTLAGVLVGDSIYVAVQHDDGEPLTSLTDSQGNTYTNVASITQTAPPVPPGLGNRVLDWWVTDNVAAAGPVTITATLSSPPAHCAIEAIQITGADPSGSFDQSGDSFGGNSATVTPSQVNELCLLATMDVADAGSYSATGGDTLLDEVPSDGVSIAAATLWQPGLGAGVPVTLSANFGPPPPPGTQTFGNVGAIAVSIKGIPGPPLAVNLDLYLDGAFVATLVTVPVGWVGPDLFATPNIPIPAGSAVQFIVNLTDWAAGEIGSFEVSFGFS